MKTASFFFILVAAFNAQSQEVSSFEKQSILNSFKNEHGLSKTVASDEQLNFLQKSAFFKTLGSNGRNCFSCHRPDQGWTMTPEKIQLRFEATKGRDPLFANVDGSNCKEAKSTDLKMKKKEYGLLLTKGLIRVDLKIPANAEFKLIKKDDPYNCEEREEISVYRRPLPSTNLRFLTGVMWDARESSGNKSLRESLLQQAADATTGHAQASKTPSLEDLNSIVDFELSLHTAQLYDNNAQNLEKGVGGGPLKLSRQFFEIGINDPMDSSGTFNENATSIFSKWNTESGRRAYINAANSAEEKKIREARASIARGQVIFSSKKFVATKVSGLNDVLKKARVTLTCTTCHNTPNVGNHSVAFPVDIGLSDVSRRTADLPLYTFKCADGQIVKTTDPGRALITGKCSDFNKMKGAVLRALSSRAPYFHNGSAATIEKVVDFYNERFTINLTAQEKKDLATFLKAL